MGDLVTRCQEDNLALNISKAMELVTDFRKCGLTRPGSINGADVEMIERFKFEGVNITVPWFTTLTPWCCTSECWSGKRLLVGSVIEHTTDLGSLFGHFRLGVDTGRAETTERSNMKTRTLVVVLWCFLTSALIADGEDDMVVPETSSTRNPAEVLTEAQELSAPLSTQPTDCDDGTDADLMGTDRPGNCMEDAHHPDVDPEGALPNCDPLSGYSDVDPEGAYPDFDSHDAHHPDGHLEDGDYPNVDSYDAHHLEGAHHPDTPSYSQEVLVESTKVVMKQVLQSGGEEQVSEPCAGASSPETMQLLGKAITDFGMEMFRKVLMKTKKPNVIISPLSVVLGLAQLSLGNRFVPIQNTTCWRNPAGQAASVEGMNRRRFGSGPLES
ncbi:uncharacterized protein LOC144606154 [Rhinoraja longicauda]